MDTARCTVSTYAVIGLYGDFLAAQRNIVTNGELSGFSRVSHAERTLQIELRKVWKGNSTWRRLRGPSGNIAREIAGNLGQRFYHGVAITRATLLSFHSSLQSQWIDTVRISRRSRWTILYEHRRRLREITVLVDLEHDTNYDVSQLLNYFTKLYSIAWNLPNDRQVSVKQRGSETDQSRRARSYILIVKLRILAMKLERWNQPISFRSM